MTAVYYPTSAFPQQFTNPDTGDLASGFVLSAYLVDTSTPTAMYTDSAGTSAGTTITLNSAGYPTVSGNEVVVFLSSDIEYKFVMRDPESNTEWTINGITMLRPEIEYNSVADMKAASLAAGTIVKTLSYYNTWTGNTAPAEGGASYQILTLAQWQSVTGFTTVDTYVDHTVANGNVAKFIGTRLSIKQAGAKGDNSTDDTAAVVAAAAYLEFTGGRLIIDSVDAVSGAYLVNDDILLYDNTVVDCNGWIKRSGVAGVYDAVFCNVAGARNITILNPLIDCDNQPGMNGIIMRRNSHVMNVFGGEIKNCAHEKSGVGASKLGGRALNIEAGITTTTDPKGLSIDGVKIKDCYAGLAISGGTGQEDAVCAIGTITMTNVEVPLQGFGNAAGYPHDGDSMSYIIDGIIATDCGKWTTYTPTGALIAMDRGSNVFISKFYCANTSAYGAIGSILLGDFHNVHIEKLVFDGDAGSIFEGFGYQESDSIADPGYNSTQNDWNIWVNGTIADVCVLSASSAARFADNRMNVVAQTITNDRAVTTQLAGMTGLELSVRELDTDVTIKGRAGDMVAGFLFSACTAGNIVRVGNVISGFDVNGIEHNLVMETNYTLKLDGVILGGQLPSFTDAELNDSTAAPNTTGKFAGRSVFNSTQAIPVYTVGQTVGALWLKFSDNTTANTPV